MLSPEIFLAAIVLAFGSGILVGFYALKRALDDKLLGVFDFDSGSSGLESDLEEELQRIEDEVNTQG